MTNTKGVEDGISDELACECGGSLRHRGWLSCVMAGLNTRGIPRSKLPAAVPEVPTFAYQLAMYLTRNGADAPHMQAEINRFLYDGKWKTTQGVKS